MMLLFLLVLVILPSSLCGQEAVGSVIVTPEIRSKTDFNYGRGYPIAMTVIVREFTLNMKMNRELIPLNFILKYYKSGKEYVKKNYANCFYRGEVEGYPEWMLIVSTCHGLVGQFGDFSLPEYTYYLKPVNKTSYFIEQPHYLYTEDEHYEEIPLTCGTSQSGSSQRTERESSLFSNLQEEQLIQNRMKRQNNLGELITELAVVVDMSEYIRQGSDVDTMTQRIFSAVNWMDAAYRTYLGTRIVLAYLEIWTDFDRITVSTNQPLLLFTFQQWSEDLSVSFDAALYITGTELDGSAIGIAYDRTLCSSFAVGVAQDVHSHFSGVAAVMSHELGHIFGAQHDDEPSRTDFCFCVDTLALDRCIMESVIGFPVAVDFSNCSQAEISAKLYGSLRLNRCLMNQPSSTVTPAVCGNAIIEGNEECDCGTIAECTNRCCDAATCTPLAPAQCASGVCCNTTTCLLQTHDVVCRTSSNNCDLEEYCTGLDISCPADLQKQTGSTCSSRGVSSICYEGSCVLSYLEQCEMHFSITKVSHPDCFAYNTRGVVDGHCGNNATAGVYLPCASEDVKCGLIICTGDYLGVFYNGISPDAGPYMRTTEGGDTCNTVSSSPTQSMRIPGLVSDGSVCATGKMCLSQRCRELSEIRPSCPNDTNGLICSGNGECNSLNHCSCDPEHEGDVCQFDYDRDECAASLDNCEMQCINTFGSFSCSCSSGYSLASDGRQCLDLDECSSNIDTCQHVCTNTVGSFDCSCTYGYVLDSNKFNCSDVDECTVGTDDCQQNCTNTAGSYNCSCNTGYTLDNNGRNCTDVNECAVGTDECQQNCTNTAGSYNCSCNTGYTLDNNGRNCTDDDECAAGIDECQQNCTNTAGSYNCSCNTGYTLDSNGRNCTDDDECAAGIDECQQNCTNTAGSYNCSCSTGYTLDNNSRNCSDIDECSTSNGGCSQVCTNSPGTFSCSCNTGYTLHSNGTACTDIDECATNNGGCSHNCTDSIGTFTCSCNIGYTLFSDGLTCNDVDECAAGTDECQQNCTNTAGSYNCSCNTGYTLDSNSRNCSDVDECSTGNNGGCSQVCTNSPGTFSCSCNTGYTLHGSGTACTDADECTQNPYLCQHGCVNIPGSFNCTCPANYTLTTNNRNCTRIDYCATNNGGCSDMCINTIVSFVCTCSPGYSIASNGYSCNDINECSTGNGGCSQSCINTVGTFSCGCTSGYTLSIDTTSCLAIIAAPVRELGAVTIAVGTSGGLFGLFLVFGAIVAFTTLLILRKNHKIVPLEEYGAGSKMEQKKPGLDSLLIENLDS